MNLSWQIAMALIFIEGLVILLLVLTNLRELIMNSIPSSLKLAIGVAIGVFIAFLGFKDAGLMVANADTFVAFGSMANPVVITALIGLIIITIFMALKFKGSILYGIILASLIAIAICLVGNCAGFAFNMFGSNAVASAGAALPAGVTNLPVWDGNIIELPNAATLSSIGQLDFVGTLHMFWNNGAFLFDGFVTLVSVVFRTGHDRLLRHDGHHSAVGGQGGLMDKEGKFPGLKSVLAVDCWQR